MERPPPRKQACHQGRVQRCASSLACGLRIPLTSAAVQFPPLPLHTLLWGLATLPNSGNQRYLRKSFVFALRDKQGMYCFAYRDTVRVQTVMRDEGRLFSSDVQMGTHVCQVRIRIKFHSPTFSVSVGTEDWDCNGVLCVQAAKCLAARFPPTTGSRPTEEDESTTKHFSNVAAPLP